MPVMANDRLCYLMTPEMGLLFDAFNRPIGKAIAGEHGMLFADRRLDIVACPDRAGMGHADIVEDSHAAFRASQEAWPQVIKPIAERESRKLPMQIFKALFEKSGHMISTKRSCRMPPCGLCTVIGCVGKLLGPSMSDGWQRSRSFLLERWNNRLRSWPLISKSSSGSQIAHRPRAGVFVKEIVEKLELPLLWQMRQIFGRSLKEGTLGAVIADAQIQERLESGRFCSQW